MNKWLAGVIGVGVFVGATAGCGDAEAPTSTAPAVAPAGTSSRYEVRVDADGYHPARIAVRAGVPATVVVTRVSDEGCGQQIVFPSLGIRRDLPLNVPVEIPLTPRAGEVAFTCGMDMLRGTIVAQ